jgi:hypothetical protein
LFAALVTLLAESRTNVIAFTFEAEPVAMLHRYFEEDNEQE